MTEHKNSRRRARFITLGCKVNQYETQGMREAMDRGGVGSARSAKDPDVAFVVINTCTVTEEADRESRYWIRRARREHPKARIVVTGCGVTRDRSEIESLPEVDLVLANHEKDTIADRLLLSCASPSVQEERAKRLQFTPLSISSSEGRTRAFVKIQDGCNHACTFCKVVLARGRSRSRALGEIVEEVTRLRDAGYREVVFAGIQLGAYGLDLKGGGAAPRLADVLESCAKISGIERLRLSSIEPTDIESSLIEVLRTLPQCCPHLHIPLQSGDDGVLARMNRRYGRAFYIDLADRLRAVLPDFSLTLDVMAGFPGEDEAAFAQTAALLARVKPLKCHVFPYSRREGTRAARFGDVPADVRAGRVRHLIALGDRLGTEVRRGYLGRTFPVLIEKFKSGADGRPQGITANYLKVAVANGGGEAGGMLDVTLTGLEGDTFLGKARRAGHDGRQEP